MREGKVICRYAYPLFILTHSLTHSVWCVSQCLFLCLFSLSLSLSLFLTLFSFLAGLKMCHYSNETWKKRHEMKMEEALSRLDLASLSFQEGDKRVPIAVGDGDIVVGERTSCHFFVSCTIMRLFLIEQTKLCNEAFAIVLSRTNYMKSVSLFPLDAYIRISL